MRLGQWQTSKELQSDLLELCKRPLPRCVAVCVDGTVCGLPAMLMDDQRGGMVCKDHGPEVGYWFCRVCERPVELNVDGPANICAICGSPRVHWEGAGR